MSRASITECEDCVEPAEAFSVVGNETRLAILEALWQADAEVVRFSRLREAVGVRDSAQFNYHLQELVGQFVAGGDEGYELKYAGKAVVRAVLAGEFTHDPEWEAFEIDGECVACGSTLVAAYADETIAVSCPECGHAHGEYPFPPGGLTDRSREEVMAAFDQRVRHLHCLAADGVCPECNGKMESEVERGGDCCLGADLRVEHECAQCGHSLCSAVGLVLLDQSDVVTFHREHGVDLNGTPYWQLPWCVSDHHTTVEREDPLRVAVDVPLDGETLHVAMDADLQVVDVARR
ncbi:ArsR family transcriptional regulator [Halorubellus sp. PRR65]|uniref:DUF7351 domain-containing protein n=1 Tax=Halorubellus sp. PRR65 TaxID=3098148 RepID=UPI002B25DF96|nr:ArsR family transcriptional regulator [Halorubellus sp. PRR65]